MTLPKKLVALHRALERHKLPHAFGGAIALAYWTLDPRGTSDIDINVFVPADEAGRALTALPRAVAQPDGTAATIARNGQVRLFWEQTPVDLFFDYVPFHARAERNAVIVPFEQVQIPILGPIELAVFKAMFDRTRDWADIEAMLAAGRVSVGAISVALAELLEPSDHRFERLQQAAAEVACAAKAE